MIQIDGDLEVTGAFETSSIVTDIISEKTSGANINASNQLRMLTDQEGSKTY